MYMKMQFLFVSQVDEGTLFWAVSFFFNAKKINIFRLIHIALL